MSEELEVSDEAYEAVAFILENYAFAEMHFHEMDDIEDFHFTLAARIDKAAGIKRLADSHQELLEACKAINGLVTELGLYETEYDGRRVTLCHGCNYQDDMERGHSDNCKYNKARQMVESAIAKAEPPTPVEVPAAVLDGVQSELVK